MKTKLTEYVVETVLIGQSIADGAPPAESVEYEVIKNEISLQCGKFNPHRGLTLPAEGLCTMFRCKDMDAVKKLLQPLIDNKFIRIECYPNGTMGAVKDYVLIMDIPQESDRQLWMKKVYDDDEGFLAVDEYYKNSGIILHNPITNFTEFCDFKSEWYASLIEITPEEATKRWGEKLKGLTSEQILEKFEGTY